MTTAPIQPVLGAGEAAEAGASAISLLNAYAPVFLIAFLVTLLATPVVRRIAIAANVVDMPDQARKVHRTPIAYLGGVAVFAGMVAAIGLSYLIHDEAMMEYGSVPIAIVIGMIAITFTGLADDVWGWDPRLKVAGQLVAAAGLAIEAVGTNVAKGLMNALFGSGTIVIDIPTPVGDVPFDLAYWLGTAIIAIFVLGGCNAANLIDGLDGLLSGVTGIAALGLLAISVMMAVAPDQTDAAESLSAPASLAGARIVLSLALLGAVLGFLPHNFNPATIFLGDCGSLLLGFLAIVIILMFGENGQTHLVFAGLIVFAVPIIDTMLAIIRRRLEGISMSVADDQHIHHQLKRATGSVRRAVFALYGIEACFAVLGVLLAAVTLFTHMRVLVVYVIALVLFSFIAVIGIKVARRHKLEIAMAAMCAKPAEAAALDRAAASVPEVDTALDGDA